MTEKSKEGIFNRPRGWAIGAAFYSGVSLPAVSLPVLSLYRGGSLLIPSLFPPYTEAVHFLFRACSLLIPWRFPSSTPPGIKPLCGLGLSEQL